MTLQQFLFAGPCLEGEAGDAGWSGRATMLGNSDNSKIGAYCTCSRCSWGIFFILAFLFSFLSTSLLETTRYRLKHCIEGPLSPRSFLIS